MVNMTMNLSCTDTKIRSFKDFGVTSLTFWGHVTSSVTWPLDSAYVVSYWRSIVTMHLSCIVTEIWGPKYIGVTTLIFGVTWRRRSRDRWTQHMWFPIGGPLEPCVYLAPIRRYWAPKILGSRLWPFGVTWRHRSRDHRTRRGHFSIGGQWWPCVYLARIRRYGASEILGSRFTSLTFWGHVMSSVTWPLDSAYVVFYWWSIRTMRLSCTITEI